MPEEPENFGTPVKGIMKEAYNLREGRSTTARVIEQVKGGEEVTYYPDNQVEGGSFKWIKVEHGSNSGFMAYQNQFNPVPVVEPPPVPEPPPSPTVIVYAPFETQVGNLNANDCGPAVSASMIQWYGLQKNLPALLSITAGDVSLFLNHGNNTTSLAQMERSLEHWNIAATVRSGSGGLTRDAIRAELDAGRPVGMLVDRSKLKPTFHAFRGSHFITVKGYANGWFWYSDSLALTAEQGDLIAIPEADFELAIYESPGNIGLHYAGVSINPLPVVEPPPPPPPPPPDPLPNREVYMAVIIVPENQLQDLKNALQPYLYKLVLVNIAVPQLTEVIN